jgi:amidase
MLLTHSPKGVRRSSKAGPMEWTPCGATNRSVSTCACSSPFSDQENRRMAARAAWSRYFNQIDVFLCPVNFTPAFPHDTRPFEERTITTPEGERPYNDQTFWVSHASLPGLPAVAAPIGCTPGGLPVGAQIVGPLYEDNTAITFAELFTDVIGGYNPPPL